MKMDKLVADIIDEAAQLSIVTLRFDDNINENTRRKISTAFETVRSDIEYELFFKPLIFGEMNV